MVTQFLQRLPADLRTTFLSLDSPAAIQAYLDSIPYVGEELNRSPLRLMQDRQGHCLDGGLFAALALSRLGYPPLIIDLVPAEGRDDDHVLAIFRQGGLIGAVAKSNYAGLRFREPIHRTLRELALTYFEAFYNTAAEKTLRAYTRPLNLRRFEASNWLWDESGVERIAKRLYRLKPISLLPPERIAGLSPVDGRAFAAGMHGTDLDGVYKLHGN